MKLLRWNSVRPQRPQGNKTEPRASHRADRGWKSRKVSPLPVEGEIFFLTFPFIEQAISPACAVCSPKPPVNECNRDISPTIPKWTVKHRSECRGSTCTFRP